MDQINIARTIALFFVCRVVGQDYYGDSSGEPDSGGYFDTIYDSMQEFPLNLDGGLRARMALNQLIGEPGRSYVCSPVSALLPLGKLALGASGACQRELFDAVGATSTSAVKSKFRTLLHDLKKLSGVKLTLCSRLYVNKDYKLDEKFESHAKDVFKSSVKKINLGQPEKVARKINNWVSQKTKGMIDSIIKPNSIAPDASIILVNAIYFSGSWKNKFTKVELRDFYTATSTRKVPMMTRDGRYKYHKNDALDAQVLEVPYKGGHASFIIFLPNTKDGLSLLLYKFKLAPDLMQTALSKLKSEHVILSMPKFTTETELDLKRAYEQVGLKSMLKVSGSGLNGMVKGEKDLFVSRAVQKCIIEVDENGTKASAASVVQVAKTSAWKKQKLEYKIFNADRAFYYMVKVKNEKIFTGVYY